MTRVAINGFGRVGRAAFRSAYETGAALKIVAVNDVAPAAQLAELLAHDTVYGAFPGEVEYDKDALIVDGFRIPVFAT